MLDILPTVNAAHFYNSRHSPSLTSETQATNTSGQIGPSGQVYGLVITRLQTLIATGHPCEDPVIGNPNAGNQKVLDLETQCLPVRRLTCARQ
ncbi:hypothetical protein RRG08_047439 [Elysia crispata]|uniref:Uncharacterized protein n=1 Tax=Elysia crispata TaxID=231223 RepID=A0AAE0YUD6_9GAST|nr:hypothetical protein RRG08_047439 [Elysia crispata]